jgi:hypothetical protein
MILTDDDNNETCFNYWCYDATHWDDHKKLMNDCFWVHSSRSRTSKLQANVNGKANVIICWNKIFKNCDKMKARRNSKLFLEIIRNPSSAVQYLLIGMEKVLCISCKCFVKLSIQSQIETNADRLTYWLGRKKKLQLSKALFVFVLNNFLHHNLFCKSYKLKRISQNVKNKIKNSKIFSYSCYVMLVDKNTFCKKNF